MQGREENLVKERVRKEGEPIIGINQLIESETRSKKIESRKIHTKQPTYFFCRENDEFMGQNSKSVQGNQILLC